METAIVNQNIEKTMNQPIVSIIMPAYNCEKYICETINSIQRQTYTNWELLVIDDGSKDNTSILCDNLSKNDSRIKVLSIQNGGVSNARNIGIEIAKGEYIAFVDSDDFWFEKTLESCLEKVDDSDLLIFGYETFPRVKKFGVQSELLLHGIDEIALEYVSLSNRHLINPIWNKLYRSNIVKENKVMFPPNISMGEDLLFNLSYFTLCKGIKIIPDCLYKYRREYSTSLSNKVRETALVEQRKLKEATDNLFELNEVVVNKTSVDFVNTIIDTVVSAIGNTHYNKGNCIQLMRKWFEDPYFRVQITSIDPSSINQNYMITLMLLKGKFSQIYYFFKIRKYLSKLKRKFWS